MGSIRVDWQRSKRVITMTIAGGLIATTLQGCFLVASTALVGSTVAAVDRRTLGAQTEDKVLIVKGESRINGAVPESAHINVTSYNRKLLLTGEVPNQEAKLAADREAKSIEGIDGVFNELVVSGASSFSSRSSDTLITSKVLASFVGEKVPTNAFKIVTERGIVYLLGRVSQQEGARAANVASRVGGVQKVVTLYEYLTENEIREIEQNNRTQSSDQQSVNNS